MSRAARACPISSKRKTWSSVATVLAGLLTVSLAVSVTVDLPKKLVWNASPSVPTGLYWIRNSPPKRGDIALVKLPKPAREFAAAEGILPRNVPALKKIAAFGGEIVCHFGRRIFINSRLVAEAQLHDFRGHKLPEWQGCHVLKPDQIFLLNDHPKSFDGRYFGWIERGSIIGIAVPIWTQ